MHDRREPGAHGFDAMPEEASFPEPESQVCVSGKEDRIGAGAILVGADDDAAAAARTVRQFAQIGGAQGGQVGHDQQDRVCAAAAHIGHALARGAVEPGTGCLTNRLDAARGRDLEDAVALADHRGPRRSGELPCGRQHPAQEELVERPAGIVGQDRAQPALAFVEGLDGDEQPGGHAVTRSWRAGSRFEANSSVVRASRA